MQKVKWFAIRSVTLLSVLLITVSDACTDFRLKANDGTILITRTMEFGIPMNANLCSSLRDQSITTTTPDGKTGMSWITKYGYLYLNGMDIDHVIDGMNEAGLSVEALFLPGETTYQTAPAGAKNIIPYYALGDYVLGNFKTIDDVKAALPTVYAVQENIPGKGNAVFPLHFIVTDSSGKSIVVEYVKGQLKIHDNTLGVVTNSPTYDWQITNLRNYIHLSPTIAHPVMVNGITFGATGQGTGMLGLPGDASPPSRFVKITALLATALPAVDATSELTLANHMINTVDIPIGFVRDSNEGKTVYDYTQWTDFKDLTHKIFYFRTYDNPAIRAVSLDKINFAKNAKILRMPIDHKTNYSQDVTQVFLTQ